jgi:undecaprenyl-diphosphatase
METWQAIVLGLVQGLTEFLPVSSSGHLGLVTHLMNVNDPGETFEVVVHLGTLLSVIVYFHKRLWQLTLSLFNKEMVEERRMIGYLILATIPAGIAGFTLKDAFNKANESPVTISLLLLVTGGVLLLPRLLKKQEVQGKAKGRPIRLPSAMAMGIGQALAIFPGISRSGSTIVSGMLTGADSSKAAEFSFLLAIPAIGGAGLVTFLGLEEFNTELMNTYLKGGAVAFVSGLFAVYAVLATVRRGKFEHFAYYCFAVGIAGFFHFKFFHGA